VAIFLIAFGITVQVEVEGLIFFCWGTPSQRKSAPLAGLTKYHNNRTQKLKPNSKPRIFPK